MAVFLFLAVGVAIGGWTGALWAILCIFLTSGLSLVYLYRLARSGRVRDPRRIPRSERVGPLRVVAGLYVLAFLTLTLLGGPPELRAMLLAFALATILFAFSTPFTNPSLHIAGISGTAICVSYVFGAWGVPVALFILPVWWARTVLDRHTPLELALGMLIGTLSTWFSFEMLA
ncbi:MAG: hypothetical protein ACRDSJ_07925 [Rubrobacteraceae bacterium]